MCLQADYFTLWGLGALFGGLLFFLVLVGFFFLFWKNPF